MDEIYAYASRQTLVVFDLDNTVMRPVQTLGSEQWFDYLVKNSIDKGETPQHAVELGLQQWLPVQSITEMAPVEPMTPFILGKFAVDGITTLALTSRSREVSETTFKQLQNLGVEFNITPLAEENINSPKPAFYKNGVIFSGDNNKGDVLKAFLQQRGWQNAGIVFVDNKQKHVDNLEQVFSGRDYVGLRYSYPDSWISALNPCAVDYQWEQFSASGVILNDQEATQHCAP